MNSYNLKLADCYIHKAAAKFPSPDGTTQIEMLNKAKVMIDNEIASIKMCSAKKVKPVLSEGEKVLLQKTFELLNKKK